jgi:hypothetical protein
MNIKSLLAGKYMNATDITPGQTLTIKSCSMETIGDAQKLVLWSYETEQGLGLSKTNLKLMCALYGEETDTWTGRKIVLHNEAVNFQGKMVDSIRVGAPAAAVTPPQEVSSKNF